MLVKVVLSYYMEGEHSKGASTPRAFAQWTELGKRAEGNCERTGWGFGPAFDSAKAGLGGPLRAWLVRSPVLCGF